MADIRVRGCEVVVPEELKDGAEANGFRVLSDGSEYLLDFLTWAEGAGVAQVVGRVRVTSDFLPSVRDRLTSSLGSHSLLVEAT